MTLRAMDRSGVLPARRTAGGRRKGSRGTVFNVTTDRLSRSYQRIQQEARDDLQDAQQDIINKLGHKLMTILDKYSNENGYAVVLDTSAQQTQVIYAAHVVDITQGIIKLHDQTYPVKAPAAASKPGSGR
jgi:Skp family chaperone for outer membrane proteins